MRTRDDIMENCPEGFEDELKEIVDEVENDVNDARKLLEDISGVSTLGNVGDCLTELERLSRELY